MITLIVVTIFGLGFAYFATQNTSSVIVNLANYSFTIPLYFVAIAALLLGLFLSLIISIFDSISAGLTIWGKDSKLKHADKEIKELTARIHELELKKPTTTKILPTS